MKMQRVARLILLVFGIGGTWGACGSDAITVDEFPQALKRAVCKRVVTCGGAVDQAACEASAFFSENRTLLTVVEAVKRGTVAYDGGNASRCLRELEADCSAALSRATSCDAIFTGTVAPGGTCVTSVECADQGACAEPVNCADACCAGTCQTVAAKAVGSSCDGIDRCAKGAFCDRGTCAPELATGSTCYGTGCVAPGECLTAAGEGIGTCTILPTTPGAACLPDANFDCGRTDERCDPVTKRCIKLTELGAACASNQECIAFANCIAGTCQVQPAEGEPCDFATNVYCQGDLICPAGVCARPPAATACVPPT